MLRSMLLSETGDHLVFYTTALFQTSDGDEAPSGWLQQQRFSHQLDSLYNDIVL